jgi:Holliday junction DNA helicase RuvA
VISSLRGVVQTAVNSLVVVEVGGVGLAVQVTPQHAASLCIGDTATLNTTLIVREDSLTLYGFTSPQELQIFELLIGVSGVGPKSALGVLAHLTPGQIEVAVHNEDDAVFRKVSGIGPKTAKLIVLSLAGKVTNMVSGQPIPAARQHNSVAENVLAALVVLGWSERVAAQAVDDVLTETSDTESVQAVLRLVLARLGPRQTGGVR